MPTKLAENLYCQTVPLPNNPLREINAYILTGERNLLIDTGFNRPECLEVLQSAFRELGIEKTDLFITHLHSDHCGLMGHFLSEGGTVYAGETDGELINFEAGNLYWRMLDDLFIKYGFPRADFGRNTDIHPGRKYCHETRVDFTYVTESDVLEYGGYRLRPVETPGHTPGHMCLYDEDKQILFAGDHILGTITPNICIELSTEDPLGDYLASLKKVEQLRVKRIFTAHGTPVEDMYGRIRELYRHHEERLGEVLKILGGEWKTAYTVAQDMTWEIDCKNWDEFPAPQKWFATGEAVSHLQYLLGRGKVTREERDGVYHYRRRERSEA